MAEENINTDKKPKKDRDELTADELEQIAGGQEQSQKMTFGEPAKKST